VADPAKARRERGSIAAVDSPTPPHSIEAEQAVLGGLLLDPSAWDQVADVINEKDFYRPDHRLIFEAIGALAGAAKPCDAVTVSEQLERTSNLEAAGGMAYLSSLARDTPTAANVRAYADIVRERSLLRQLIHAGTEIAAAVYNNEGETARDLVDRAEQRVFEIAEQGFRGRQGAIAVRSLLPQVIDQIDEWHTNPDKLRGLPTGFTDFDKLTGGLRPGDLVIVAGRPSMGKTTLAVNMAEYAAVHQGTKASVAIFSMEMPSEQVITRMLSSIGGVPLGNLRSGRISDDDWVRITSATSQLSEAKIFVDETPALTPTELRARARRIKREHGLNLVVVDYLQLMQVPGTKENRATEIAEISRGLKVLAKELAVPVIALSQLNRAVEQRDHKKPIMSDLRECVTGDTLVWLTDGRQVPISKLVGTRPEVWAVDEQQRVVAARADMVWKVGRRPVASVKLATGRSIRVTAEHRVLSGEGWVRAAKLRTGDRVALARRVPEPARPNRWPDHWLIGGDGNRRHSAGVGKWLQELGIWGQRCHEKRLPEQVFTLAKEQIALLLRHLWARDGGVLVPPPGSRRAARVYFSTRSAGLAKDVAALLLRLGIVARLSVSLGVPDTRPLHTVDVSGAEFLRRFAQTVGGFGPQASPLSVLAERGASYGGTGHFRPAPGRALIGEPARSLTAPALEPLATSDLFWDRVLDVVPQIGEEDVYDLTVPGPSSWLSDGIVSHNSGAIEQDADMILLIYREEVYDKNTTKKGIAEIDLVKHRNGEIGTFRLTFQGQYTRFANYAPDAYAEGVLR
jgi:replicative DNA helicase